MTGSLNTDRAGHTATLLPNGLVFITGGSKTTTPGLGVGVTTAELYDPDTGLFRVVGDHGVNTEHIAILLQNGKVLIVSTMGRQLLFDPTTEIFSDTGGMSTVRRGATATLLNDGRLLVAGGFTGAGEFATFFNSAELYDPNTGTFGVSSSMTTPRRGHTATLLPSGQILVVGGASAGGGTELSSAELYIPSNP